MKNQKPIVVPHRVPPPTSYLQSRRMSTSANWIQIEKEKAEEDEKNNKDQEKDGQSQKPDDDNHSVGDEQNDENEDKSEQLKQEDVLQPIEEVQ